MTARTRRQQRLHSEKHVQWKKWVLFSGVLLITTLVLVFLFRFRPWKVECITSLNTYCVASVQNHIEPLKQTPLWRSPSQFHPIEAAILNDHPSIAEVSFRRTWKGTVQISITEAEPLFPIRWNNQDSLVRSNGSITAANTPSIPLVLIEDPFAISAEPLEIQYDESTLQTISALYDELKTFQPNIQKIVIRSLSEVVLTPEGYGEIYMRIGTKEEVDSQVATLQAFFHSTTMNKEYQTLDIRFRDVIIK